MAKNRKEQKPLIDITAASLIAEKHKYYLGVDNRMCSVYCHLIDSIAADKDWDLDEVEWIHEDGRSFLGLQVVKSALEVYREPLEQGLTVCHVQAENRTYGHTLVVLEREDGDRENAYHCHRYFEIGGNWTHSFDAQNVDVETVWKWLKSPGAVPTDGME
jgi:hypothetical protein